MEQRPPKRVRRIRIEDGSRWDWIQSPPPTQAACASMEWRFFQRQGYEVAEGELPVRPLRTRFIPLAEHLDEKRLVSRVTYRLSTYPQKDRPFIFSNRREEDGCYAAYVAS